ncbi:hypothetical protein MPSEU_000316100 [Mayamaea pseudoterrestris]|nr:hypothetical protein MPSEU_000316100 [Mayamaea pseudoterrestris]
MRSPSVVALAFGCVLAALAGVLMLLSSPSSSRTSSLQRQDDHSHRSLQTTFAAAAAASTTTNVASLPVLAYMGNNGQGGVFPLEECQADCDFDAECMPGLICFQRNAGDPVPGCSGTEDVYGYDYCVDPNAVVSVNVNVVSVDTQAPTEAPLPDYYAEEDKPVTYYISTSYSSASGDTVGEADDYYNNDDVDGDDGPPATNDDTTDDADDNIMDDNNQADYTVSDPFVLKMYWQEGYRWQQETFERKWCMRCDSSQQECASGRGIYVTNCDADMTTNWEYLNLADGSFSLRLRDADLCMQANGFARVTVEPCDLSNPSQNWRGVNGVAEFNNRFELRAQPYPNDCVTQQHHPRQGEFLYLYPCELPESDTTNFWNMIGPS